MATKDDPFEILICVGPNLSNLVAVRMKIGAELLEEYCSYHNAVTVIVRYVKLFKSIQKYLKFSIIT